MCHREPLYSLSELVEFQIQRFRRGSIEPDPFTLKLYFEISFSR